jgi:hypothetical protein
MPRRVHRHVLVLSLVALAGAAGLGTGVAKSAPEGKSRLKPGLYVGKTSQGSPVRLRLTVGGSCGGVACLFSARSRAGIRIAVPCPDGSEVMTSLAPEGGVAMNGVVHDFQQIGGLSILALFTVSTRGVVRGELPTTVIRKDGSECKARVTLVARLKSGDRTS